MALDLSGLDAPTAPADTAARAPLRRFEEDPENPRSEFGGPEFESLVEDIKQRGILQPLVVTKAAHGKLRIRFGARRFRAAVILKLDTIPYVVIDDVRQLDSYAQVSENEQRKNLEPLELARFIARRAAGGESQADIAKKIGLSKPAVTYLAALNEAPPFVLELYASGRCRSPQFLYRLSRLYANNAKAVEGRLAQGDDITGRLLDELASEVEEPAQQTPSPVTAAQKKKEPVHAVAAEATESTKSSKDVSQRAPKPREASEPSAIAKPLLMAEHNHRKATVLLAKHPSAPGRIFIRYSDDGVEADVRCSEIILASLTDTV
jgi:ParB family chromosome partitioning protein